MTAPKPQTMTFAEATSERDRLAAEARAAGEVADRLAAERWALLDERRREWATTVLADHAETAGGLRTAETAAARAFREAALDGDGRGAFLDWIDRRNDVNLHRDRVVAARAALGEDQLDDGGYQFRDQPAYSVELDRALAAEASSRFGDRQTCLQREINDVDAIDS